MILQLSFIAIALLSLPFSSASFSCSISDPRCLGSFLNSPMIVDALTTQNGNVNSQNGLGEAARCPEIMVIFARGTGEPGNVGLLAGPPFFNALVTYMGSGSKYLGVQGVNYSADVQGFLAGGSSQGASSLASLITKTVTTNCPSTSLILSGYSQGAQIVHAAVQAVSSRIVSKISSVILFGDPKNGIALKGIAPWKVLTICHHDDNICSGGQNVGMAHLNYSADASTAAKFALQSVAGLGILS